MSAKLLAKIRVIIALSIWVVGVFFLSQLAVGLSVAALSSAGVSFFLLDSATGTMLISVLVYVLTIGVLILTGRKINRLAADSKIFGVSRTLSWSDIGIGLLAVLPYFILSAIVAAAVAWLGGGNELNQNQVLPFTDVNTSTELILAFATLVVMAPLAEELIFRGYYYGKLRARISAFSAIAISAAVFGLLHLPGEVTSGGIDLQTAVALDTLVLGVVLGSLREFTGSVWAGFVLHVTKNAIAFFFLFIYPGLGGTL